MAKTMQRCETTFGLKLNREEKEKLETLALVTRRSAADVIRLLLAQAELSGHTDIRLSDRRVK